MKKLHLFIILLSEAAVYRTKRVELNSSRILKLIIEDWPNKTNVEKDYIGHGRFECLAIPLSNITLSYGGFSL